jgi:hypothetical protein
MSKITRRTLARGGALGLVGVMAAPAAPGLVAACRIDRRRVSTARDDAVQENGTYGGQGKAWLRTADGFAVFEWPPNLCASGNGPRRSHFQNLGFAPLRNPHVTHAALKCLQFRQTADLWNWAYKPPHSYATARAAWSGMKGVLVAVHKAPRPSHPPK